jgi:hypothetical protein
VGAAVTPRSLHGEDSALLVTHFNSITAENAMKMGPIHPTEGNISGKTRIPSSTSQKAWFKDSWTQSLLARSSAIMDV